jgi:HAD superfamily hydrolase (TIGR01509 family)
LALNTKMPVVKGVVFDLGGVVIDWNPMHLYRKVFPGDEAKARHFLENVCTGAWNEQQDAGRDLREATAERLALFPSWEREIRAYYGRWIEMIGGPVPGTAELMADIKAAGLRLFALSNWHSETFAQVRHRFKELDMFEHIVLSGEYGCIKPHPSLYQIALNCYGVPPENLVFVDDSPRNVDGAAQAGLAALVFTDAGKLRTELIALGVPIPAEARSSANN